MKVSRPNINLSEIAPFFQVLVFDKTQYTRKKLRSDIFKKIKQIKKGNRIVEVDWLSQTNKILAMRISFRELPSWLDKVHLANAKSISPLENIEHGLILIDDSHSHLFVHSSNKKLEDLIHSIIHEDWKQSKIDVKKMYHALAEITLNIKSLGINNTFGAGGTAAEAKSYYAKDAALSLTPSFDAGYSFSYCLGSQIDHAGASSVFGCSIKKRKFWGTWTEGWHSFSSRCHEIDDSLKSSNTGEFINLLVRPIAVDKPDTLEPLSMYIDYVIQAKGMVILEINKVSLSDWYCTVSSKTKFIIGNDSINVAITITNITNSSAIFEYENPGKTAQIIVTEDDSNTKNKKRMDLVAFLNRGENFTLIFNEGCAFRDGSFWQDNRLTTTFSKSVNLDISWSGVDIRKEASASKNPKLICISERTKEHLFSLITKENILAIIEDDGANEIADHIVVCRGKIILVHEKFSSKPTPGLRVDDLQVVSSQLIKNIRYLFPKSHKDKDQRLFDNAIYLDKSCKSKDDLIDAITKALSAPYSQNECWIVQPGLSKDRLDKKPKNKIHVLLSHLASICASNNTEFKIFGSK